MSAVTWYSAGTWITQYWELAARSSGAQTGKTIATNANDKNFKRNNRVQSHYLVTWYFLCLDLFHQDSNTRLGKSLVIRKTWF